MKKYFAFIAFLFVLIFTFTSNDIKEHPHTSNAPLVTIQCENTSIPNFKLGYDANPSTDEINQLCTCLWDKLVGWEKEIAIKIATGMQEEINAVYRAGFPAIFGKRISECGGEKL